MGLNEEVCLTEELSPVMREECCLHFQRIQYCMHALGNAGVFRWLFTWQEKVYLLRLRLEKSKVELAKMPLQSTLESFSHSHSKLQHAFLALKRQTAHVNGQLGASRRCLVAANLEFDALEARLGANSADLGNSTLLCICLLSYGQGMWRSVSRVAQT